MPKCETGNAAFTLTEVVIAVVLMVLALGLLISAFISSKRSIAVAQANLTAMQVARSEAERLQTNAYDDIVSASTSLTNKFVAYRVDDVVVTTNKFKDITITVEWLAPSSLRRQTLTNYLTICDPD